MKNSVNVLTATAAAAALVAATLTMVSSPTQAMPAFAQKTGQTCGVCHVNPKGGGDLKAPAETKAPAKAKAKK